MDRNGVGRARLRDAAERRAGHAKHIARYPQQRSIAVYVYGTIRPIYLEHEGHPSFRSGTWEHRLQVRPGATVALAWHRGIAWPCARLAYFGTNETVTRSDYPAALCNFSLNSQTDVPAATGAAPSISRPSTPDRPALTAINNKHRFARSTFGSGYLTIWIWLWVVRKLHSSS
jgi:hypothetical protein